MDPTVWNERYSAADLVWSAEPNRFLPPEVAGLPPGRALDVACGEGRNAIWLARQGWDVVAVDFAEAGIAKGRRLAAEAGVAIDWVVADVTTWEPPGSFDLVIVFYFQLLAADMDAALDRCCAALAPGATLLVVGHHVDNIDHGYGGPTNREYLHDPSAIADALVAHGLVIERAEMVERPVDTADGARVALDSLVRAHASPA
jgi:SAM-dependent methyltransferase